MSVFLVPYKRLCKYFQRILISIYIYRYFLAQFKYTLIHLFGLIGRYTMYFLSVSISNYIYIFWPYEACMLWIIWEHQHWTNYTYWASQKVCVLCISRVRPYLIWTVSSLRLRVWPTLRRAIATRRSTITLYSRGTSSRNLQRSWPHIQRRNRKKIHDISTTREYIVFLWHMKAIVN